MYVNPRSDVKFDIIDNKTQQVNQKDFVSFNQLLPNVIKKTSISTYS